MRHIAFVPDCPTAFRRPPNCFLKREHALTVPAAWPGAGADAGMGAKAGGCNSDHDFVCNCDCRPSAEAYADSFRPEGRRINPLRKHTYANSFCLGLVQINPPRKYMLAVSALRASTSTLSVKICLRLPPGAWAYQPPAEAYAYSFRRGGGKHTLTVSGLKVIWTWTQFHP